MQSKKKIAVLAAPTSKLPPKVEGGRAKPSCVEPVSHMGGLKIHLDDPSYKASYKAFVSWIEGQVTIDARWRDGFPQAEKVDGRLLR